MPFEIWYLPFVEAGSQNTSYLGQVEAEGYISTEGREKFKDKGADFFMRERVVVAGSGKLKKFDTKDSKLIVVGHCEPMGVSLESESTDSLGRKIQLRANELAKRLVVEEGIRKIEEVQIFACHSATGDDTGKHSFAESFGKELARRLASLKSVSGFTEKLDRPALQFGNKTVRGGGKAHDHKRVYSRNELIDVPLNG